MLPCSIVDIVNFQQTSSQSHFNFGISNIVWNKICNSFNTAQTHTITNSHKQT